MQARVAPAGRGPSVEGLPVAELQVFKPVDQHPRVPHVCPILANGLP
jgi:hypothetical protein